MPAFSTIETVAQRIEPFGDKFVPMAALIEVFDDLNWYGNREHPVQEALEVLSAQGHIVLCSRPYTTASGETIYVDGLRKATIIRNAVLLKLSGVLAQMEPTPTDF